MSDKKKEQREAQATWTKVQNELDAYGRTAYALNDNVEIETRILPDENISPSKFKLHPTIDNCYIAHPLTIRAMKKDIFLLGDDVIFHNVQCKSCSKSVELECWSFCPFCGGELSSIIM